MTTQAEIIDGALRSLGVIGEGETANADQLLTALAALNQMITAWAEEGIDLQFFPQTDATAVIPIPPWSERGVRACLSVELAAEYGVSPSESLANAATKGYQSILRIAMNAEVQEADLSHLPMGQAYIAQE